VTCAELVSNPSQKKLTLILACIGQEHKHEEDRSCDLTVANEINKCMELQEIARELDRYMERLSMCAGRDIDSTTVETQRFLTEKLESLQSTL
jgi:hypothetical protein